MRRFTATAGPARRTRKTLDAAIRLAEELVATAPATIATTKAMLSRLPLSLDTLLAWEADTQALLAARTMSAKASAPSRNGARPTSREHDAMVHAGADPMRTEIETVP